MVKIRGGVSVRIRLEGCGGGTHLELFHGGCQALLCFFQRQLLGLNAWI